MTNEEKLNLSFPEKLYVGIQGRKPFDTTTYPLGFATPFGTDKAFEKRKKTVDDWCGQRYSREVIWIDKAQHLYEKDANGHAKYLEIDHGEYEPPVIDNVMIEGFSFEKSVRRYETNNKLFRINDPRGFCLEISAENLGDILLNCVIENGDLKGKFMWARARGNVFLCRENHPSYQEYLSPLIKEATSIEVGDRLKMGQETEDYIYLGKYYTLRLGTTYRWFVTATGERKPLDYEPTYNEKYGSQYGWGGAGNRVYPMQQRRCFGYTKDYQAVHVFKRVNDSYGIGLKLMRSKPKNFKVLERNVAFEKPSSTDLTLCYSTGIVADSAMIAFENKKDLENFDATAFDFVGRWNQVTNYDYQKTNDFVGDLEVDR